MDRTNEPDEETLRLPVAYSQGYVYVSVIHDSGAGSEVAKASEPDEVSPASTEEVKDNSDLGPTLALMALAALFAPLMGATIFVLAHHA